MADTGLPWQMPYPQVTDVPNAPVAMQELAEKTHAALGYAYPCTAGTRPASKPGLIIYETDTDDLLIGDGTGWTQLAFGDDTGWVDAVEAGWTPVGAFTISNGACRRKNGLVSIHITCVSTNAITAGDYANTNFLQAPAGYIPASSNGGFNGGANGREHAMYIASNGLVVLTAGGGISAGGTFNCTGTYML